MARRTESERGQALVEFSLIVSILFILSLSLVDVGRGFYAYNLIAQAARYGARWGGVVGGTCAQQSGTTDWCSEQSSSNSTFWSLAGNVPAQSHNAATDSTTGLPTDYCPHNYDSTKSSYYYQVSNYTGSSNSTIVGAIAQRFDTTSSSSNTVNGSSSPGLSLSHMYVCIQLPNDAWINNSWQPEQGDYVTVFVYYQFQPINSLITKVHQINMVASSQYVIE